MPTCQGRAGDREAEREQTDQYKNRETMELIDLDARAAVRAGPDGGQTAQWFVTG